MSEWISTNVRLPDAEDYDVNGSVWLGFPDEESDLEYASAHDVERAAEKWDDAYWTPTGLTRPEPPKEPSHD